MAKFDEVMEGGEGEAEGEAQRLESESCSDGAVVGSLNVASNGALLFVASISM
jgi:hypothetical protein